MFNFDKLQRLLRFHRQNVFNETNGDAHGRALHRLKRSATFKAYCAANEADSRYRASERLLSAYA